METLILAAIRRTNNGATHGQILGAVAPETMLARRVFAQAMLGLQRSGQVVTAPCPHGDHDTRYRVPVWHDDAKACCA